VNKGCLVVISDAFFIHEKLVMHPVTEPELVDQFLQCVQIQDLCKWTCLVKIKGMKSDIKERSGRNNGKESI
jgi:hypothetical protein